MNREHRARLLATTYATHARAEEVAEAIGGPNWRTRYTVEPVGFSGYNIVTVARAIARNVAQRTAGNMAKGAAICANMAEAPRAHVLAAMHAEGIPTNTARRVYQLWKSGN